jgi:hypothetical protein
MDKAFDHTACCLHGHHHHCCKPGLNMVTNTTDTVACFKMIPTSSSWCWPACAFPRKLGVAAPTQTNEPLPPAWRMRYGRGAAAVLGTRCRATVLPWRVFSCLHGCRSFRGQCADKRVSHRMQAATLGARATVP